jgi:hypothetical protein
MPKNAARTDAEMAALHAHEGLEEAFRALYEALPTGAWVDRIELKSDKFNILYGENVRWFVSCGGIDTFVGWDEEAEGPTLPEALTLLTAKVRERHFEDDPFAPSSFDALSFLAGDNVNGITFEQAYDIFERTGPYNPLRGQTAETFKPVKPVRVNLGDLHR